MKTQVLAALTAMLLLTATPPQSPLPIGSAPAAAQAALIFDNLGMTGDFGALRIPRISIEGTNATRADIEALFDPKQAATVAERLRRINARSISIPLIELDQKLPDGVTTTVYRDTLIRNVANGIIGEATTPVMSMTGKGRGTGRNAKPVDIEMTAANMTMKGLDLGLMLAAVFTGGGQPNEPLKIVAQEQTIGRITLKAGDDGTMSFAGASMKDFRMRVLPRSMMDLVSEAQRNEQEKKPDWQKKNLALVLPVFSSMGIGTAEITGFSGEFKEPGKTEKGQFTLDRVALAGETLVPNMMRLQGLRVATAGTKVALGEVTFDRMDMASMFSAVLKAAETGVDPEPAELLPKIGLIRIGGVDIDAPDAKNPRERVKLKLGLFETTMGAHIGAIPTALKMTLDKLQLDIPANTRESGLQELLKLGYTALDVSAGYELSWQEAQKTLLLKDLTVRSEGMFSLTSSAVLANVPRELFTTDKAKAAVAALGIVAKSLDATLVNTGLFERIIANQAKDSGRKIDDVRAELAAGATMLVPLMLGGHPAARTLGSVFGTFVADPKNVTISLTSKDGNGIGATDFMAVRDPMDVLKKVEIKAGANQ